MLPTSHQYLIHISSNQGHISVIKKLEKHEDRDLPPYFKIVFILNCGLFHFWCWSPPHFGLFTLLGCFSKGIFWFKWVWSTICLRRGRGRKLCLKGPNETPRHLHDTNFGALNNLLQKELLIKALYTHLIVRGKRD